MRRGLGSLLAVWVLVALLGSTVESTAALASGRGARAHKQSAHIKQSSHVDRARSSQARDRGIGLAYPGAAGLPVRVLQRRLARAGDAPGPIDGRYGPLTERAVEQFQAARGLAIDGIAGPRTWAALSTPGEELFPTAGYYSAGGSEPVRVLQRRLARAGDTPGPIDGRYGPRTEHAVRRFQATHGLHVDGIAHRRTLIDLKAATAARRPIPASTRPRRARPRVAARPPVITPAPRTSAPNTPAPKSVSQTHGSSSPAKWLVLLGILALAVVLRVRHVARPTDGGILPPDTVFTQPRPQLEPGPPTGLLAAEDDRTHPEAAWQRDEAQRGRAALLERERQRQTERGREKR